MATPVAGKGDAETMNLNHSDRAQVLVEALPYIQRYYDKTICH